MYGKRGVPPNQILYVLLCGQLMKLVSIKDRLIMGLMITSLTSLVVASLAFSFYELQRYKKFKEAELVQIVDLLGPQGRRHIMAGDWQQAESWLSTRPLLGMPQGRTTSKAEIRSVAIISNRSPSL